MQKQDKYGKVNIEWLEDRVKDLENKRASVQWYIKFDKQSKEFKQNLINRYNKYLK